jgi:hypothetical protein
VKASTYLVRFLTFRPGSIPRLPVAIIIIIIIIIQV